MLVSSTIILHFCVERLIEEFFHGLVHTILIFEEATATLALKVDVEEAGRCTSGHQLGNFVLLVGEQFGKIDCFEVSNLEIALLLSNRLRHGEQNILWVWLKGV